MKLRLIKFNKVLIFSITFFLLIFNNCFAQDISVEMEIDRNTVVIGSSATLTLTVNGTQDAPPVTLPEIDGLDIKYYGPSKRISIVNGNFSSSIAFTYSVFPLKEGHYEIPKLEVMISGNTYYTNPVSIDVVASASSAPAKKTSGPIDIKDKVFLVFNIPKSELYINEKLPLKVFLFVSDIPVRDIRFPEIEATGFVFEDYQDHKQYRQNIKGINYEVVEFDMTAYPTRNGEVTLGPAKMECNILVKNQRRRSSLDSFGGGFFGDSFFDDFFDQAEKRPIVLKSNTLNVNVKDLPLEGKPKDFSNAVGNFNFDVTVSPNVVKVGDPITIRMNIEGDGNLKAINFPKLKQRSDFKFYDPIIKEEGKSKILEQVIIPKSEKVNKIDPIIFTYFDVKLNKYRTIEKGPFSINVEKLGKGDDFKVIGLNKFDEVIEPEKLGKDIVFIKDNPGDFKLRGKHIYNSWAYYLVTIFCLFIWLSLFILFKRTRRLETDIVYAKKLLAPKYAKKGLSNAAKFLEQNKKQEFYDAVHKTLMLYFGNKFHLSSGTITFETIKYKLSNDKKYSDILYDIKLIFEECEMIRYASGSMNENKMKDSYKRAENIIDFLERNFR